VKPSDVCRLSHLEVPTGHLDGKAGITSRRLLPPDEAISAIAKEGFWAPR
jgi:hypothetical protein